ncbi:MAG: lipoyl(octanoyl) transferase LipB [Phycisphaerales bacterium]|jgi:lipoate-protein ligase B|nr:lipoyl(octanoyl) transferase LipB [Phycisphaerales bacterium]
MSCQLNIEDLGKIAYEQALELQRITQKKVIELRGDPSPTQFNLLLLEHDPPVITVSKRKDVLKNLVSTKGQLAQHGVKVVNTDRGGDITYHGLGQLVGYPIFDLNALSLRLHGYMRFLEGTIINALKHFGIDGERDECATGVWVDGEKICAMGVRVSRWVSMHGFALNVNPNMEHFKLIIPCGLEGRKVTSLQQLLLGSCPSMSEVKKVVANEFKKTIADQVQVQKEHRL